MFKPAVSAFLLLALLAIGQGHSFKQIDFHNGGRLLEDSSLKKITSEQGYIQNAAVKVDFGKDFNTTNEIKENQPTEMLIWLSTNVTGFITSGQSYFKTFDCKAPYCSESPSSSSTTNNFEYPYLRISSGYRATVNFDLINADGGHPWKLNGTALSASWGSGWTYNDPYYDYNINKNASLVANKTYGWIGLGIDGDAIKNFAAEEPIFSVQMGAKAGQGSIIFGKDTTLYKSSVTPQVFTANGNWTLKAQNYTVGVNMTTVPSFAADVIFDMNADYIGIPDSYLNGTGAYGFVNEFRKYHYNPYNTTLYPTTDGYTYTKDLSLLPNLIIGLKDGKSLTISPHVYMKAVEGFPGHYIHRFKEINSVANSGTRHWIVLGAPVLRSYYTVFNKLKEGEPTITMYPTFEVISNPTASSNTLLYIIIAIVVAVVVIGLVLLKGKGASASNTISMLKKPSSGLELR